MRFLVLLSVVTGLTLFVGATSAFMAAGQWQFGVPLFIVGTTIAMWLWERSL